MKKKLLEQFCVYLLKFLTTFSSLNWINKSCVSSAKKYVPLKSIITKSGKEDNNFR